MYCVNPMRYTIQQGDTLEQIAQQHNTTVSMLLAQNLNIDPQNLRIGSQISICPGKSPAPSNPMSAPNATLKMALSNDMRLAWSQHVYWTRMLLISIAERLNDQSEVTRRLLRNPKDIADIYARYYPADVAKQIARLLTDHLQIGAELITALRDGKTGEADRLTAQWYKNADEMATAFSSLNPHYHYEELREMLHSHLRLTTQEVSMRLASNYAADIGAFDKVESEAMMMADYLTAGIMKHKS